MHIWFDKIDGFIITRVGQFRYLVLFDHVLFDTINDKIKYLVIKKSGITDIINHNFGKIRIDSYNALSTEKILTFHNAIILIKWSVRINMNSTMIYF